MRITSSIPTTPTCSTMSCASSASGSRPWWPRPKAPRKRPAGCSRSTTSCCRRCSIRKWPWSRARPILHDKSVAFRDNIYVDIHGELGNVEQGFKEADAIHEMTYSTSRAQHVHLETHGSHRLAGRRRAAACAHQLAGAVHRQAEALLSVRAVRPRRACLHRARRRRLRRQAGDDLRGSVRARRAEDRPAGDVGVHARRAVHRRHHAPSDDHACEARRQEGRHAHRDPGARRLQHRRLWQPWRRDAGRRARQPDRRLSLPQQEGRRLRRLHQHGAGRRLPRLWRLADHLRHRMRHRRSGASCSASTRSRSGA